LTLNFISFVILVIAHNRDEPHKIVKNKPAMGCNARRNINMDWQEMN